MTGMDLVTLSGQAPTQVAGLPQEALSVLQALWTTWARRRSKNLLLSAYYDGHRALQDLGISVPPQMQSVRAALGWPAKAVTALARKHVFEGFSLKGTTDAFEMGWLLAANDFEVELAQAITSAYKHSCSFLTVTAGDTSTGEPPVVVQARDAETSAALWDRRRREVQAFLTIDSADSRGQADGAVLYTREETWHLTRSKGRWQAVPLGNRTGRVLAEPIVYDPQLSRPFGRSRISREVRYLTDAAIRTLVRAETSAEFYSSPQRYVLGVDEDAFKGQDRWSAIIGRLLALEPNENGDIPQVGQFSQLSMEPHLSMYRQLAQNFCAATNLPQSSVGLFADNPASAEAMQAAEAALADEAEAQWRVFRGPLRRVLQDAVMIRDRLTQAPQESWSVDVRWTPARYASPSASADYAVKMVQAFPALEGSPTLMRRAGMTETDLAQVEVEQSVGAARSLLESLALSPDAQPQER